MEKVGPLPSVCDILDMCCVFICAGEVKYPSGASYKVCVSTCHTACIDYYCTLILTSRGALMTVTTTALGHTHGQMDLATQETLFMAGKAGI